MLELSHEWWRCFCDSSLSMLPSNSYKPTYTCKKMKTTVLWMLSQPITGLRTNGMQAVYILHSHQSHHNTTTNGHDAWCLTLILIAFLLSPHPFFPFPSSLPPSPSPHWRGAWLFFSCCMVVVVSAVLLVKAVANCTHTTQEQPPPGAVAQQHTLQWMLVPLFLEHQEVMLCDSWCSFS